MLLYSLAAWLSFSANLIIRWRQLHVREAAGSDGAGPSRARTDPVSSYVQEQLARARQLERELD